MGGGKFGVIGHTVGGAGDQFMGASGSQNAITNGGREGMDKEDSGCAFLLLDDHDVGGGGGAVGVARSGTRNLRHHLLDAVVTQRARALERTDEAPKTLVEFLEGLGSNSVLGLGS